MGVEDMRGPGEWEMDDWNEPEPELPWFVWISLEGV